jgi:hypothetical protein
MGVQYDVLFENIDFDESTGDITGSGKDLHSELKEFKIYGKS